MDAVKIGLLGLGNVGSGVWQILSDNADEIAEKVGARLEIARVLVHDPDKGRRVSVRRGLLTTDADSVVRDPDIPIIVEAIGCPGQDTELARDYMLSALRAGKHVITANKECWPGMGASCGRQWPTAAGCTMKARWQAESPSSRCSKRP